MTTSTKTINLYTKFHSTSLVTRQTARDIFDEISTSSDSFICIDFNQIQFASRSFFDELYSKKNKFRLLGKDVKYNNLSNNLQKMLEAVSIVSRTRGNLPFTYLGNAETITI